MRTRTTTILATAAITAAILAGCANDEPTEPTLPPLGSEAPTPSPTPTPSANPEAVTIPPAFDVPLDEETAIADAAVHVQAYQAAAAYLMNWDVEGDDRITAFTLGTALDDVVTSLAYGTQNRLTTEGVPEFTLQGGTAQLAEMDGQMLDYGTAQLYGCLDLSTRALYVDGVEQIADGEQRGVFRYILIYSPDRGNWLVTSSDYAGEAC